MATGPVFGKVEEFNGGREEWTKYTERLGHFLDVKRIMENDKKQAILLSVVGPSTYRLLKSLLASAKPGVKTYNKVVTQLTTHYAPSPSETVQRHKFHLRVRRDGETVAIFVSELHLIATFCNFGDNLEQMLRDRLICGINDTIQNRLLVEAKLDFKKAKELAQSL